MPGGFHEISITYAPSIVGMYTNAQYLIKTLGGNELKLQCMGQADGTEISLSSKSIHFGEVQLTSTTNRLLNIINESD